MTKNSKASIAAGSAPVVTLATPAVPAGIKTREDGALVCAHCGHKVTNLEDITNWDGSVGHVCATNLTTGYRSVQTQVTSVPADWILVAEIHNRCVQAKEYDLWMSYWRASGKDGGVNAPPYPQFEYRYIGGSAASGKGGRKWTRPYSIAEIKRILALTPEQAQAEFKAEQECKAMLAAEAAELAKLEAETKPE